MVEAKIEVAWSKARAEEIAREHRAEGGEAKVKPYDDETFCVHAWDECGVHMGLLAKYAGTVQ